MVTGTISKGTHPNFSNKTLQEKKILNSTQDWPF